MTDDQTMSDTKEEHPSTSGEAPNKPPIVVIVLGRSCVAATCVLVDCHVYAINTGMAGSGKTTLMKRLQHHLHKTSSPCYVVNLDPAVSNLPYEPNIDIRDTV